MTAIVLSPDLIQADAQTRAGDKPTRTSTGLWGALTGMLAARRAAAELATLDDRLLRDIGLSPTEIAHVRVKNTALPLIWS